MPELMQLLEEYKEDKIALYGLGVETEKLLGRMNGAYHIIGLLDSYREEGELYGQKIIPLAETIKEGCKLILVVARPGSCRAIAQRIEKICREHDIALYDVRGNNLCEHHRAVYELKKAAGITKKQLEQMINEQDVLSLDLFDTMIMRQTLLPSDVVELVDCKLRERGIFIEEFVKRRMQSEKRLSQIVAPTLVEIYEDVLKEAPNIGISAKELAELEWQTDYELVVPRKEFCNYIKAFFDKGKKVYIVSDTYYTREQLVKLLDKCDITCYTDILTSCEYHTGKTQELFQRLLEITGSKHCLHIGDDSIADVENAVKNGLQACKICSGMDLMEQVGYLGMWEYLNNLSDRIKIGMFVAELFNSPFQFEMQNCRIRVENSQNLGYLFFAPMVCDFVMWFAKQMECNRIKNIWFCARDGYLIQKLYRELCPEKKTTYFLTSRIAAIRAGVQNAEDVRYVENMRFSGTVVEQLKKRFGIVANEEREKLTDYLDEILTQTAIDRENAKKYISKLSIEEGDIAFFDFVAKGTCQMFVGHLLNQHLKGFYFLQLEKEQMQGMDLDIVSYYGDDERNSSAIFDDYYILETMLTAPMPSVTGFDKEGIPYYAEETRSKDDIFCFQKAQDGIERYFSTYLKICPKMIRTENKKLDEIFLKMIHSVDITDNAFLKLQVEDIFFNRMTDMPGLI